MFLNKLDREEQITFLKLAHYIARIDGDFSTNEKNVIQTYCLEMQIEDIVYNEKDIHLDVLLSNIKSTKNQKIVLLEIMALIYSDGLHQQEQEILNIILDKYHISSELALLYAEWTKTILSIVKQGQILIEI